jgi:ABC-2 type transport system permease protein
VGALVSTEHDAQTVQLPVAMLLIFSALFIEPVLLSPESDLARILGIIPFSAPVLMPLRLSLIAVSPTDIVLSVIALAAGSYITVWIGARIYRTGLLMYGKRPTVREIVRWIRYAP